jgi:hypothetical protein
MALAGRRSLTALRGGVIPQSLVVLLVSKTPATQTTSAMPHPVATILVAAPLSRLYQAGIIGATEPRPSQR